jgi:hypothetical protein
MGKPKNADLIARIAELEAELEAEKAPKERAKKAPTAKQVKAKELRDLVEARNKEAGVAMKNAHWHCKGEDGKSPCLQADGTIRHYSESGSAAHKHQSTTGHKMLNVSTNKLAKVPTPSPKD